MEDGVPRTIINEDTHLEGAAPEPLFVGKVLETLGMMTARELNELLEENTAQSHGHEEETRA